MSYVNINGVKHNVTIASKQDTSYLFSSMGTYGNSNSGVNALASLVSDYSSIKNGTYGKLMRAHYANETSSAKGTSSSSTNDVLSKLTNHSSAAKSSTSSLSESETKAYTKVQSSTDKLSESADALLNKGTKSVFAKKDITTKDEDGNESTSYGYDKDAIYSAVNSFVQNYNSVLDSTKDVNDTSISNRVTSMENETKANKSALSSIGITIGDDNKLSIDKDKFLGADMDKVKSLFNGTGSYAYSTSVSAGMINSNADYALSKANTYADNGNYSNNYNVGSLYSTTT
ncbi:MAG: hypothetical protein IJ608_05145 [Lachnospiraceae bacterium]|nr:hypothetical protein [Lachnospiraceae bacterium]